MDTYDVVLAILKFVGIASTGAFAVLGIVHDFKDDQKRLTRWGRIAIVGVVASALLSTVSHSLEVLKAKNDLERQNEEADRKRTSEAQKTDAERARTNELLFQVQRTLEPIEIRQIQFEIGLSFSAADPAFSAYRSRLETVYAELKAEADRTGNKLVEWNTKGIRYLRSGPVEAVTIVPGSPYWPDPDHPNEEQAAEVLNVLGVGLHVVNPRYPDDSEAIDIGLGGRLDGRRVPGTESFYGELSYRPTKNRISIHVDRAGDTGFVDTSTAFQSAVDFIGADVTMEVATPPSQVPSMMLAEFRVSFGPRARTLIAEKDVKKAARKDETVFSFKLVERWYPVTRGDLRSN